MRKIQFFAFLAIILACLCLYAIAYLFFDFQSQIRLSDIFILLCFLFSSLLIFFSLKRSEAFFSKLVLFTIAFEFIAQLTFLYEVIYLEPSSDLILSMGRMVSAGGLIGGFFQLVANWVLYGLFFYFAFIKNKKLAYIESKAHLGMILSTFAITFLLIPLLFVLLPLANGSQGFGEALQKCILSMTGFAMLFLRIDMIRSLAIASFSHRYLEDQGLESGQNGKFNFNAFVFGVRWYFFKGIVGKAFLLLIPYALLFLPYAGYTCWAAFFGTRVYAGLMGNKDYAQMKGKLAKPTSPLPR